MEETKEWSPDVAVEKGEWREEGERQPCLMLKMSCWSEFTKCVPRISKLCGALFSRKHLVSFASAEERPISLPVEVS